MLRRMKSEGHSIIIITHKLNEVMEISERVSILRKGEYIATVDTKETSEQELTELMVGRKVNLSIERAENGICASASGNPASYNQKRRRAQTR